MRYCGTGTSENGTSIQGLNESWTGFVAWGSGDFIVTNQTQFVRGNAEKGSEEWQRYNLTAQASEALEPVPGAVSASAVVIARKNLADSVPPAEPEKPAPGTVSAEVARFDVEAGSFQAIELFEEVLEGAEIAQAAAT